MKRGTVVIKEIVRDIPLFTKLCANCDEKHQEHRLRAQIGSEYSNSKRCPKHVLNLLTVFEMTWITFYLGTVWRNLLLVIAISLGWYDDKQHNSLLIGETLALLPRCFFLELAG